MQETLENNQKIAARKQLFTSRQGLIRMLVVLVLLVAGALSIIPYFFSHYTEVGGGRDYKLIHTHDLTNHYFVMGQFEAAARAGALYPRWLAEGNKGYGIATMNYYPPGFFYLTTFVNAIFNDWHSTLLFIMILAFAGSGIALYFLARTFYGRVPSAIAALVYILLPYHQVDLYWRGALPELLGFVIIPLTLYFAYKVGTAGRWRDYAGLGFCYGIHLLTHLPVAVMFSYALAFYALVWAARERDFKIAIRIAAGMALGLFVSAIYWFPAALEAKYAYEYASIVFPYHGSYVNTLPTADPFERIIQNSLKFSVLFLLIAIAVLRLAPNKVKQAGDAFEPPEQAATNKTQALPQVRIWIIMCGATLFMTTAYSYDISKLLPKIEVTVPPFRWMAISAVFTSLLVAACVDCLSKVDGLSRWRLWAYRGVAGAVIALSLWLTFSKVIPGALEKSTFLPTVNYIEQGLIPKDAAAPEKLPDTPAVVIEPQNGYSEIARWQPQSREVRVTVDQQSKVRLRTYNFPGWTARVDGQKVPLLSDKDGVQIIDVAPGSHTIEVTFENTPPRIIGAAFTTIGFLAVFGLAIADYLKRNRRRADLPRAITLEQGEKLLSDEAPKTKQLALSRKKIIIVAMIAAVIAAVALVTIVKRSNRNFQLRSKTAAVAGSSEARLSVEGLDSIPVAADDVTLNELVSALASKDGAKVDALTSSGKVIKVAGNTRIRILERAAGKTKVLITEGEHQAEEGWVVERWVR